MEEGEPIWPEKGYMGGQSLLKGEAEGETDHDDDSEQLMMRHIEWWGKQFGSDSGLRPDWLDPLTLTIFDHQNPATPPFFSLRPHVPRFPRRTVPARP